MKIQVVICTIFLLFFSNNTFSQTSLEKLKSELNTLTKGMSAENRSFSVNNVKIHDYSTLVFYSESSHKYIYLSPYSINPNSVKIESDGDDNRGVLYKIQFTGNKIFAVSKNKYKGITDDLDWEYNSGEVRFYNIFGVSTTDRRRVQGVVDLLKEISKPIYTPPSNNPEITYKSPHDLLEVMRHKWLNIYFYSEEMDKVEVLRGKKIHQLSTKSLVWGIGRHPGIENTAKGVKLEGIHAKVYFNNKLLKNKKLDCPAKKGTLFGDVLRWDDFGEIPTGEYTVKIFYKNELLKSDSITIHP